MQVQQISQSMKQAAPSHVTMQAQSLYELGDSLILTSGTKLNNVITVVMAVTMVTWPSHKNIAAYFNSLYCLIHTNSITT